MKPIPHQLLAKAWREPARPTTAKLSQAFFVLLAIEPFVTFNLLAARHLRAKRTGLQEQEERLEALLDSSGLI